MSAAFWLNLGIGAGALLSLALILSGGRHLWRRRVKRGCAHGFFGVVAGLIVAVVLLAGLNLLTYARFTAEQPVGTISFVKLGPQRYNATLRRADGHIEHVTLRGDQWVLDARVIKWTGVGTMLGLEPLYKLERLSGRYADIRQARHAPRSVVSLTREAGLDLWEIARDQAGWLPLVDAAYGMATYLPMADGAVYRVSLSTTGLLARPANDPARQALGRWH